MWVHVVIFMATAGIGIAWKAGWLRLDGFADRESIRLFLIVAVCGNCLGMALTMTSGVREIYTDGYRLEKETTGAYTEEFEVSVDGQDAEKIDVQIPEKESEEGQAAEKTEKEESPEESRKKELREAIEKYNEIKKDPDYYYLPKDWKGQKLEWQKPGDTTGTLIAALSLFAAFVLMLKKTREEQEASAKRAEQLLMDYPSLILKFTLLIQAGLTARRAFQKMASDYLRSQPVKGHFANDSTGLPGDGQWRGRTGGLSSFWRTVRSDEI